MSNDGASRQEESGATDDLALSINAEDGRLLLSVERDGTVVGEIEDASEAARVFVGCVRQLMADIDRLDPRGGITH